MAYNMLCYHLLVVVASTWLSVTADEIYTSAMLKRIAELDEGIDDTINPCDDFQKYLCSKVDARYIEDAQKISDKTVADIHLERLNNSDDASVKKAFTFFKVCENGISQINKTVKFILADLDDIFKDENGKYLKFDATLVTKISAYLFLFNLNVFTDADFSKPAVKPVWYSPGDMILAISEPELSQARERYDPKILPSQADAIKESFRDPYVFLEPTKSEAEVNATLTEFLHFETNVSKLFAFPEASKLQLVSTIPFTTVAKAMDEFPVIDWKLLITLLSNYSGADVLKRFKPEDYPMQVFNTNVTKGLPDIIANTPDELLRKYIRVRLVTELMTNLHQFDCLERTWKLFPILKQYLYMVERYPKFDELQKLKNSVTKLTDSVMSNARSMMEEVSWMKNDNQTFAGFTDKINKLKKIIAFPDILTNQTWRNEQYKDFDITENDNLYSMYLKEQKFNIKKKTFEDIDEINPGLDITDPNANYSPALNLMIVKLALLLDLAYHPDYAPAYNYGFLGSILGHEIIHGVDTDGINFDSEGYVKHWMSNNSQASFDRMATCVVDWYSKFSMTDSKGKVWQLNGNITSGENVADNGGIRASYNAFKSDPANMQPFPRTKKLKNLTQEQLFFMGFGSFFCSPPLPDPFFESSFTDEHAPHPLRLLGTLQNFEPFREAFNCPAKSKYAPEKHCNVYAPDLDSGAVALIPSFVLFVTVVFFNGQ